MKTKKKQDPLLLLYSFVQKNTAYFFTGIGFLIGVLFMSVALMATEVVIEDGNTFHSSAPQFSFEDVVSFSDFILEDRCEEHCGVINDQRDFSEVLDLVQSYFELYNSRDYGSACGLLKDSTCNEDNPADVRRFAEEGGRLVDGYEDLTLWMSPLADGFHSDVACVQYSFEYERYPNRIHELMSFYVNKGGDEKQITSRVCEKKNIEGIGDVGCPILSKQDFCLDGISW